MALKKRQQKTKRRPKIRKGVLVGAVVTAFIMIGFAGMISAGMAISVAGVLAVAFAAMYEKRRRVFWESAMHFKMRKLKDGHDKLARDIARNRTDIAKIKSTRNEAAPVIKKQPAHPAEPTNAPRALKPSQVPQAQTDVSNDAEMEYYNGLSDTVVTELTRHAVGTGDINVFVQPVMRLPQRKARFYEMFARIRVKPGLYVPAARYLEIAKKEGLLNDIDELLLTHCIDSLQDGAAQDGALAYFLNITSSTLKNTDFMRRLLGFISTNRDLAPRLVFEICQSDFDDMQPAVLEILRGLGKLGCSLSLDHIEHYDFDIPLLTALKVRFVKFEAKMLIEKGSSEKGAASIWRLKRKLENNGIGFVAGKIEDEHTLKELLDFDIHYGQGYLLGKPDMRGAYTKTDAAKHIREARRRTARYSA